METRRQENKMTSGKVEKLKKRIPYCFSPLLGGRLRGGTYQLVNFLTYQLKEM